MGERRDDFLGRYDWRINWLYSQWGEGTKPVLLDIEQTGNEATRIDTQKVLRNGQIRIYRGDKTYDLIGRAIDDSMR